MLALATPGFAENRSGAFTVSPYVGGYTFDHEQMYQNLENSPIFGIRAGYNFTENWGLEGRFGYVLAEDRNPNYPESDVYSYGIDALYHFNLTPNFVPFLAAGIGGMHHSFGNKDMGYYPEYAANYGVGLKYFVADNVALRADVRHVILPDDNLNNLEYTGGVTFQFGGAKPAPAPAPTPAPVAKVVECPVVVPDTTPPTVSLTDPGKGAMDADINKQISVAFSEPMDAASINDQTITLLKGDVPVPGKVRAFSATAATFTETDRLEPGTQYTGKVSTGVKDLAGNAMRSDYVWSFTTAPVPVPKVVTNTVTKTETKVVVVSKFVMLGNTHFEFDKATLTPAGKEALKKNIQILKDNPDIRVRISGYTSAAGSVKYNQALSERRAESAKAFVVQEGGIAAERIETIGFGETRPAEVERNPAAHNSPAAKANMRVLFEVIEK
jgi:OOP family OmpA-OmpF porin